MGAGRGGAGGGPLRAVAASWLRAALLAVTAAGVALAGLTALFATVAITTTWDLPEPAPVRGPSELFDADGDSLLRITSEVDRTEVTLDQIAEAAVEAVIVAEDARFRDHDGVDPLSLVRAVVTNVRTGGITQGGSTLTQQYVKNAFVGDDQTVRRKVEEAVLAIQLERELTKDEILTAYLNTASFGGGTTGIEAAAQTYFGVAASDLDAAQSATLAQALPAPSVRDPRSDPDGARARRDVLLTRMGEQGALSAGEVAEAQAQDLEVRPRPTVSTDSPAVAGYARRQLEHQLGAATLTGGGLTVSTTLDRRVQTALDDAVATVLPAADAGPFEAAAVALDPRTGAILAIHGGRDLQLGDLDLATMARRQNGSALKPFVLAAALEDGLVSVDDRRPTPAQLTIDRCVDHDGGPISVRGGPGGALTLHQALARSVNTTYQELGCELGGPRIVEQLTRSGVASDVTPEAAVALGGSRFGASVLDLAAAYGTLLNDGVACPTHAITEIRDADGRPVPFEAEVVLTPGQPRTPRTTGPALDGVDDPDGDGPCTAVTTPATARQVTAALVDAVADGTGTAAALDDREVAGKTGTSTDLKDAWFVGGTPELVVAVWIGDPGRDGPVRELRDVAGVAEVFGGTLPAMLWREAAARILADTPPTSFPRVEDLDVDDGEPRVGPARPVPAPPTPPAPGPATDDLEGADDDGADADGTEPGDDVDGSTDPPPPPDDPTGTTPPDEPPADDRGDRCLLVFRC